MYRRIGHLQTKKPPLVSLKTFRKVSQKGKKPRLKKSEKEQRAWMRKVTAKKA